jgi:hypothetical protein
VLDALPDLLAAIACATAWIRPDALGFDLLMWTAPLYFVELPLALVLLFAGVRRMNAGELSRREKLRVVLVPALLLAALAGWLLGSEGLIAVLWLGSLQVWRLLRGTPESSAVAHGSWLVYDRLARSYSMEERRPQARKGLVVVPAGHEQVMAAVTLGCWVWVPISFLLLAPNFGVGGVTPEYAAAVGWNATLLGKATLPAHWCLAAGLILFTLRGLAHFEGLDDEPPPRIEDDALLQEVIDRVEGRGAGRAKTRDP